MNSESPDFLAAVDPSTLLPIVAEALQCMPTRIFDWSCKRLTGGGDAYDTGQGGVYRLSGQALVDGQSCDWRLILKIFEGSGDHRDPNGLHYWEREARLYDSPLHSAMVGIKAPRLLAIERPSCDLILLWLACVPGSTADRWSLEQFAVAANHLGRFNGSMRHVVADAEPSWLSSGRIVPWFAMAAPQIKRLPELLDHQRIRRWMTPDVAARTLDLWTRRQELLDIYAQLPKTFCHHDAHRRNLFLRREEDGAQQTIAIDWAFAGAGVVGEDIATLMAVAVQFGDAPAESLAAFDSEIFDCYLAGLVASGWQDDKITVRLGFTLSAALTWALATFWWMVPAAVDLEMQGVVEAVLGTTIDELVDDWADLQVYLLDLADEAVALAGDK